jgi:hypothetical protein
MTADRYTKTVLTVIAISLVWIAIQLTTVPTAEATAPAQRVNIVGVGGFSLAGQRALPVRIIEADPQQGR